MRKKIITLLVLIITIMTACQFHQVPEGTIVVDKYTIPQKTTKRFNPVIQTTEEITISERYFLVLLDSTGYNYHINTSKFLFQETNVGDTLFYNKDTNTLKFNP